MSPSGARRALLHAFTAWPKKGGTALHFAAATGRSEVVDFLLDLEVQILFSEQRASESADAAELDSDTSLSQELLLNVVDGDGNNPLCCAAEAEKDNSAVVHSLLDVQSVSRGFNRDKLIRSFVQTNKFGMGALLIAASKGHINTLYCLLKQAFGPFLNAADWVDIMYIADTSRNKDCLESNNLFHYCVERAKIDEFQKVLKLLPTAHDQQADWHLIAEGMLVASSNFDINALELALQRGRSDICELFLEEMIARIRKRDTEIISSGLEYIFRSNSNVDSRCNNVLHLYALGGGTTETGRLLIEWLELSAKWLSEAYGSGWLARTMIRIWDWQPEGPSIVAALISQLNCAGETPCITALKRGHKDALQALLPFWDKKLVLQYRNPVEQGDTFLHCYAKSKAGFDLFSLQELPSELQGCTASCLVTADHPFTMRNWQGHTPMLSALYSAQTVSFRCLLKQRKPLEGQVQQSDNALHVYAYCCDDEQAGSELIEGLGKEQVKAEIGKSIQLEIEPTAADARPITDQQVGPFKIKGTPLMLAIAGGNLQACKAIKKGAKKHNMKLDELLDISFNQSMDAESGNNVLHFLCTNMKSGSNLQEFWNILTQPSKVATTSDFAEKLITAKNKAGETPLIRALKIGNTTAAEWLLLQADKYSEQKEPEKEAEYTSTARAVFSAFQDGSCRQLGLWKKLKAIYCRPPMSPKIANSALRESILKEISTNSQEILQSVTKDDSTKNLLATKNLSAEDGSRFWPSYLDHVSNLDNIAILIVMKRNMRNFKAPNQKDCFREALKKGNLKLFEMALQGKTYNYFKEEFDKDQYESFLRHFFMGDSNYKLSLFLIQELCVKKCSSPKVSWKRFLRLVGSNYGAVGAWTWAVANLMERPWQGPVQEPRTSVPEILEDVAAEMRTHLRKTLMQFVKRPITDPRAVQQQRQYSSAAKRNTRSVLLDVCYKLLPSLLAGESDRNGRTDTRQDLLKEVEEDHPSLVYFLLRSGAFLKNDASSGWSSTSDLTGETVQPAMVDSARLLQLVYTYSRRGFLGNLDVVLDFLDDEVLGGRKSDKEAALSKPVDIEHKIGRRSIKEKLPILIACALHCPLATLIKVLSVAQFCKAEGMVDKEGYTSLHHACDSNKKEVVIALTTMCPNLLDIMTSDGRTPLLVAARLSGSEIVEHLLSLTKPSLSFIRDIHGHTALHFAATSTGEDTAKVVKMLLDRAKHDEDQALLMDGTDQELSNVHNHDVNELLKKDDEKKLSPPELLELAVRKKNWPMVKSLINKGAKLTSTLHQDVLQDLDIYETKQLDQPTMSDSLGREGLAKGIASLFLNPFNAAIPITVGVLGSWGMGKSSIMLQTQIHILMTLVERNILPSNIDSQSMGQNSLASAKLEKLQYKVLQAKEKLASQRLNESASKHKVFWNWWANSKPKKEEMQKDIENFVSGYKPDCISLYKGLALMSRHDLFQYHSVEKQHQGSSQVEMPPCLTIYYNAWLYHGESDASSGLALTIMQELEACLSTAQWLKFCWDYACRSNPLFSLTNMCLPLLVLVAISGIIVWITWEFLSIPSIAKHEPWSNFKYGSIPMSIVVTLYVILKKILNFARPVSMQILQSTYTSKKYKSKTGFHQEIINDIQFFKDHLGKNVGLGWKFIGKVWSLLSYGVDNISRSSIKKFQTLKDELRIIVFIDDLDRCVNPDYIIELLGAINLILSTCAISVVLGMDKNIVSSILQNKDIYDAAAVEKFLEKVINIPIDLYEPTELNTAHFLGDQLMYAKSKENKPLSNFSNQKSSNMFKRQDETTPSWPATPASISQNQRLPQQMDYEDTQWSQVCENIYSQEDSILDVDSKDDCKRIVIVEEKFKSEESKIVICNMQDEKETSRSTPSESNKLHDQHKTPVLERKQLSNSRQEGYKKKNNRLLVQFPLSLTNYNEAEVKIFKMLQGSAKTEQKKPRNWKRLLSYHQLVRSILLESKKDMLDRISGWPGQLIIWLFVCYNWKERMNEIFKNWKDLFIIKKPRLGVATWPSLQQMVSLQQQKHKKSTNPDLKDECFQRVSTDWRELEETLYGGFDVDMESINIFQDYRYHCNIGHMQWEKVHF